MDRRPSTMYFSVGGSSLLPQESQVDLVNWLDNNPAPAQQLKQGFRDGAKETYRPSSTSPLPASTWSPAYPDDYDDLLGANLSSENLDDCLSLNMKDDNWHRKLSGADAEWAEQVSRDYRQLKQQKKRISSGHLPASDNLSGHLPDHLSGHLPDHLSGHLADHLSGQLADHLSGHLPDHLSGDRQQYTDDGYLSNEPTDSPPHQGGFYSPLSAPRSSANNSPFSEAYNSPEYQTFYTPEQSIRQNNDWDLNELEENYVKSLVESVSLPTSPNGQQYVESSENTEDFDSIYKIVCGNSPNYITSDGTNLEMGLAYQNENLWDDNSALETSSSSNVQESEKMLLKDVISEEGDSILQNLISPIKQANGSEITACYNASSSYSEPREVTFQQTGYEQTGAKRPKKVPFTAEERRLRKKEQNKRAAIKYREKKKVQVDDIYERYEAVVNRNKELKEEKKRTLAEFDVIRSLLLEKLKLSQGR